MGHFKNSLIAFTIVTAAALSSFSVNASILIEPHLGYNVAGGGTNSATVYKYSGLQMGARLGLQFVGLMGGLAYNSSSYDLKSTNTGVTTTTAEKQSEIGAFLGYNAPVLLRGWLGYYPKLKSTATDNSYIQGNTTEIGLGFTGLPFVSLNLIYRMLKYDKYTSAAGVDITLSPVYDFKEVVLGVSLPFTL